VGILDDGHTVLRPVALTDLGMDESVVGLFVVVMQFSSIFSNVLWAWIGQRRGNQALLSIGTWFLAFSILIPLTIGLIPPMEVAVFAWEDRRASLISASLTTP
jgi:hypothetical protein